MSEAPLSCKRDLFDIPRDLHYLNCAYMGPLPHASLEVGIAGLRLKTVPSVIVPSDFFDVSNELRVQFSRLLGVGDPARVAIQPGVSYGIATAARNLPLSKGQNVVLTHEQFPGNVHAWTRKAREVGAQVRWATPPEGPGRGAAWNERLLESIDVSTAIVACAHVHWTDGTLFDLVAVGERCREVGAALVIDATQSLGALPFDLDRIQPDAVMCATYKWLLGPYSLSLGYFSERFDDGTPIEETWIGRENSEDFQHLVDYQETYQPGAVRFDVSERSNFALVPVAVSSLRLVNSWTPARVQEYCRALTAGLISEARDLGYVIEDDRWRAGHLFGLRTPPGVDLGALRDALAARKVSASLRGTALRVSPNVYNDEVDIGALRAVLQDSVRR